GNFLACDVRLDGRRIQMRLEYEAAHAAQLRVSRRIEKIDRPGPAVGALMRVEIDRPDQDRVSADNRCGCPSGPPPAPSGTGGLPLRAATRAAILRSARAGLRRVRRQPHAE